MPTIATFTRAAPLFALLFLGTGALADQRTNVDDIGLFDPPASLSGSYLAARSADRERDIGAAARYYANALSADPRNPGLMERALILGLASGKLDSSFALAERMVVFDPANPAARVALAARDIKAGDFEAATSGLALTAPADLATLTATMMQAWIDFGEGRTDDALKTIENLEGPQWYDIFKDYHTAMILDAAGRTDEAATAIKRAYKEDTTALRVVDGYARILARAGQTDAAMRALVTFAGEDPLHPAVRVLYDQIKAGTKPEPTAPTVDAGIAELLYGLGSAIGIEDGAELSAAYLRLARYVDPKATLVTMALGDAFQATNRCQDAIDIYEEVPVSEPLRRNADIQIGNCLRTLERSDEAIAAIKRVADANPADYEAAMELGNLYRAAERFGEAADAYSDGIAAMPAGEDTDWRIYYFRGISYERSKQWAKAEKDFRRALELQPDEPRVLNYLGYSWVDQGQNLQEALGMIRKAVELRPADGYIVDSLGWAYYRLGRHEEAVQELEEAVSLTPGDPVINDHLGDAYWQVGRKREALFQWAHARDFDPAEADLPKILAKLEHGLDGADKPDDRSEVIVEPGSGTVVVAPGDTLSDIAARVLGDASLYQQLLDANRDRLSNPDMIYPGMQLNVPPGPATAAAPAATN